MGGSQPRTLRRLVTSGFCGHCDLPSRAAASRRPALDERRRLASSLRRAEPWSRWFMRTFQSILVRLITLRSHRAQNRGDVAARNGLCRAARTSYRTLRPSAWSVCQGHRVASVPWAGPRRSVEALADRHGRQTVVAACLDLLAGREVDGRLPLALAALLRDGQFREVLRCLTTGCESAESLGVV